MPQRKRNHVALCASTATNARLARFETCGTNAYVCRAEDDPDCLTTIANFCNDRFCMPCARERSRKIAAALMNRERLEEVKFLTLTLKASRMSLGDTVDRIWKKFTKLRGTAFWKESVEGGIAFLETHYIPDSDSWHTHLHTLIHACYMPHARLKALWLQITGDSDIVDIRWPRSSQNVMKYVAKYASKPMDTTAHAEQERLTEAIDALAGRRLYVQFGSWRNRPLKDEDLKRGWIVICSLDELVQAAKRNDAHAIELLNKLHCRDLQKVVDDTPLDGVSEPRAPPAVPPSTAYLFPTHAGPFD